MNYSDLIKDASLEQIVSMNKLVEYLLEQPSRQKVDHLKAIKMAGEIAEDAKFKLMMHEPEQEVEMVLNRIDDIVSTAECLERIGRTGCAYPDVLLSRNYPLKKE